MSGTGSDVVPNLPKCPVPVMMLYRTYRSVRYRYESMYRYRRYRYPYRTELTEVSGTGVDVVPKLPKCPLPVLMSYRTCRSVRYRQYRRYVSVRTVPDTPLKICWGIVRHYSSAVFTFSESYGELRRGFPLYGVTCGFLCSTTYSSQKIPKIN